MGERTVLLLVHTANSIPQRKCRGGQDADPPVEYPDMAMYTKTQERTMRRTMVHGEDHDINHDEQISKTRFLFWGTNKVEAYKLIEVDCGYRCRQDSQATRQLNHAWPLMHVTS